MSVDTWQWVLLALLFIWCVALSAFANASADLSLTLGRKIKEIISHLNGSNNP